MKFNESINSNQAGPNQSVQDRFIGNSRAVSSVGRCPFMPRSFRKVGVCTSVAIHFAVFSLFFLSLRSGTQAIFLAEAGGISQAHSAHPSHAPSHAGFNGAGIPAKPPLSVEIVPALEEPVVTMDEPVTALSAASLIESPTVLVATESLKNARRIAPDSTERPMKTKRKHKEPPMTSTKVVNQPLPSTAIDTEVGDTEVGDMEAIGAHLISASVPISSGSGMSMLNSSSAGVLFAPKPPYPIGARRAGFSGTVVLDVEIGADGRPISVDVSRSSGREDCDTAAQRTVAYKWQFDGERFLRRARQQVAVRFELVD